MRVAGGRHVTIAGAINVPSRLTRHAHPGEPDWVRQSLHTAQELMSALPESSAAHYKSALTRWDNFVRVRGITEEQVSPADVTCFCISRIAQPAGLPAALRGPRGPICTGTLRRELNWIRRGRKAHGLSTAPFDHTEVVDFLNKVATRAAKVKSDKNPVLFADVKATDPGNGASFDKLRNHAILALGFFFGLRSGEFPQLRISHLSFTHGNAVGLRLLIDKRNYSTLSTQIPRQLQSGGTALCAWLRRYLHAFPPGMPRGPTASLFPCLAGSRRFALPLAQRSIAIIVGELVPGCTGHSMRVGFCTEAVAAGVKPRELGEFGRWLSVDMQRLYSHRTTDAGVLMARSLMRGRVQRRADGTLSRTAKRPRPDGDNDNVDNDKNSRGPKRRRG